MFTQVTLSAEYGEWEPRAIKMPIFEVFRDVATKANEKAPKGMNNLRQSSEGWLFMPSEAMLV